MNFAPVLHSLINLHCLKPQPYKENPDIVAMTDLLESYEQNKIKDFERILQHNRGRFSSNPSRPSNPSLYPHSTNPLPLDKIL